LAIAMRRWGVERHAVDVDCMYCTWKNGMPSGVPRAGAGAIAVRLGLACRDRDGTSTRGFEKTNIGFPLLVRDVASATRDAA